MDGSRLCFYDLTGARYLLHSLEGEEVMYSNGQFYIKQGEHILVVEYIESARNILPCVRPVAVVMMKSTQVFEGIAIQNLLGTYYASILPSSGACHQVRLPELDGSQLLDAKLYRNVLMVLGTKAGRYDKLIFRFADDFGSYDVRVVPYISSINLDFTVLDSGVVLHMADEDQLEIFSRLKDSTNIKALQDPSLQGDVRIFHTGAQALIARGNSLYKIKMRQ